MKKNEKYNLLYRSYDSELSPEEQAALDRLLQSDDDFRNYKRTADKIFSDLTVGLQFSYSPGFPDMIVQTQPEKSFDVKKEIYDEMLNRVFLKVSFASSIAILLIVVINVLFFNGFTINELFFIEDSTIEEVFVPHLSQEVYP